MSTDPDLQSKGSFRESYAVSDDANDESHLAEMESVIRIFEEEGIWEQETNGVQRFVHDQIQVSKFFGGEKLLCD